MELEYLPPIGHQNLRTVQSLSFLNGNRGLQLFTLHSVSDSLGHIAAESKCMTSLIKMGIGMQIKANGQRR